MVQRTFRAMGTDVELLLDAPAGVPAEAALVAAEAEIHRLEGLLSRFRPESELSRLNRAGSLACGSDLVRVATLALVARERTAGSFDPTVHDAVVAAGYDRSFDELEPDGPDGDAAPAPCGREVEIRGTTITLEPRSRLDLGGIAKGYAADRACELLAAAGPCLVNTGGDIVVSGGSWAVGVTDDLTLELTSGGLATSGRDRRRWRRGGEERHHIIDPATGRPAASPYLRVTVAAPSAAEAEVLAKAAFLGADVDAPRVLVLSDGRVVMAGGLT